MATMSFMMLGLPCTAGLARLREGLPGDELFVCTLFSGSSAFSQALGDATMVAFVFEDKTNTTLGFCEPGVGVAPLY